MLKRLASHPKKWAFGSEGSLASEVKSASVICKHQTRPSGAAVGAAEVTPHVRYGRTDHARNTSPANYSGPVRYASTSRVPVLQAGRFSVRVHRLQSPKETYTEWLSV